MSVIRGDQLLDFWHFGVYDVKDFMSSFHVIMCQMFQ